MGYSLEQSVVSPTYLEFFGLTRPPFARIAEPSQFFQTEQYSLLMGHLGNATNRAGCLVALCGARGAGKSTLLDQYVASLGHQITLVAIDGRCRGEEGFYCEFLTQIGFTDISGTANELRNITTEFLKYRGNAGDPVLVIVDNAHESEAVVLEQVRHIASITTNGRRVVSVVLAGDTDLGKTIDSPAMSHTGFDSHIVFNIRAYTEEETANYVWHRLRFSGGNSGVIFAHEAFPLIHRFSGGSPGLINRLCNVLLAEAFRLESRIITDKIVRAVANKQRLLPYVIPLHGRGRRKTDPDVGDAKHLPDTEEHIETGGAAPQEPPDQPEAQWADADPGHLQQRVAALAEQIEDLRADKRRVLKEVAKRSEEFGELRDELDAKTAEVEALSDEKLALKNKENVIKALAAELDTQKQAREAAEKALAEATALADRLSGQNRKLQETVDSLETGLKAADARAADVSSLEKDAALLQDEQTVEIEALGKTISELNAALEQKSLDVDAVRKELDSRDEMLADLKVLLDRSQRAEKLAHLRMLKLKSPRELRAMQAASIKLAADLETETAARRAAEEELQKVTTELDELRQLEQDMQATVGDVQADLESEPDDAAVVSADDARGHPSVVVQRFEESISNKPAYQTLRQYDPAFYFSLIATYKRLIGLGHTDKQVNDALRAEQAELIEKLLPKASGNAVMAYAQLVVDQLDEFKRCGTEPCFTLLIPQTNRGIHALPVFSERTREFELAVLDITLKTYDDKRRIPGDDDVWTDLEPIFLKLFAAYGKDNVSAATNSDDSGTDRAIDRELLCDINRSLYSGILELPKRSAVNAFRWVLSP